MDFTKELFNIFNEIIATANIQIKHYYPDPTEIK
jgi:hypothetical protein